MDMPGHLGKKLDALIRTLRNYGDMALAFSGGKDSALLVKVGVEALGRNRVLAMTAVSPIRKPEESKLAMSLTRRLGVHHEFVYTNEYKNAEFVENPERRCFICKDELFDRLAKLAASSGFENLVDGTNSDDSLENRPTFAVAKRYDIKWPLVEAGLGAEDVEHLLAYLGLAAYIRPHYSCSAAEMNLRDMTN